MLSRYHYHPPPPSFRVTRLELSSEVDYEYIPPNPSNLFTTTSDSSLSPRLSSVYPPGTPAGLRGEAVRSALLSKRCIAWDLSPSHDEQQSSSSTSSSSSLSCGWIRVKGKGTMDFLQNKFTQSLDPSTSSSFSYTKACLLTPKGRVVDQISIALVQPNEAFLMTSPGHAGSSLFQRLDPLIFPMDQVTLMDESSSTKIFSIASTHIQHVQNAIVTYVTPVLNQHNYQLLEVSSSSSSSSSSLVSSLQTPSSDTNFVQYTLKYMTTTDNNNNNNNNNNDDDEDEDDRITMTILPQIHLSPSACQGYTIVLSGSDDKKHAAIKERIWEALVGDENSNGPVEIGMLEYETLRIETGWPAYGKEVTAGLPQHQKKKKKSPQKTTTTTNDDESLHETSPTTADSASSSSNSNSSSSSKRRMTPANPLELHWDRDFVNTEKGCYLGQEGVASILKNPKGPPRTLYSVIFEDEGNIYDHESEGDNSDVENLTTTPVPGNELFVLGSNEQIAVGTLTSVADAGGTGEPCTVALALVKRPASILKQMKRMDLEVGYTNPLLEDTPPPPRMMNTIESDGGGGIHEDNRNTVASESSGIIQPPPLDPLEGLEVIVGGTFTIGKLQAVPSRRYIRGENMFEVAVANNGVGIDDEAGMDGSVMGVRFTDVLQVERTIPSRDEDVIANKDVAAVAATTASATPSTDNYVPPVGYDIDHQEEEEEEEEDDVEMALEEVAKAQAEAEAAAAEAQRKADKMEMLKKRAEEAMARRQKAKEDAMNTNKETENVEKSSFTGNDNNNNEEEEEEEDAVAAEAKRKAEKMEMLRKRAEEAMARRTQKKNEGS